MGKDKLWDTFSDLMLNGEVRLVNDKCARYTALTKNEDEIVVANRDCSTPLYQGDSWELAFQAFEERRWIPDHGAEVVVECPTCHQFPMVLRARERVIRGAADELIQYLTEGCSIRYVSKDEASQGLLLCNCSQDRRK